MTRSRNTLLVSVLFGLLSSNVTFTIFNVALVDMAHGLHTTPTTLTWAITGPLLTVGVAAPILGRLGDIYGHRRLYLFGLVGSLVCAAMTALAWNAGSLIAARLFSGFGSASLSAASWAILFRVFSPAERTRVLGWWSLVGAGGPVLGVAFGGPIVQAFGWRWIFVIQIPLIIAAFIANRALLTETEHLPGAGSGVDLPGAALLAFGVGAALFAINQAGKGWTSPEVLGSVLAAAVALPAFGLFERRARSPIFPVEWLSNRDFVLPCIAAFAINFAYMGGFFLTPLFLEQGLHYSIGAAGFFQIARPLVFAIAAPAAGYLAVRTGEKPAAAAGGVLMILSMLAFAMIGTGSSAALIVVALSVSGLACGVSIPCISALVADAADVDRMGSASAGMQVASQVGVVAGIQVMETVQSTRAQLAGVVGSYHEAYLAGAAVAVAAVAASALIRSARRLAVAAETGLGPETAVELG